MDWKTRAAGGYVGEPPFTVGWDIAGVVTALGARTLLALPSRAVDIALGPAAQNTVGAITVRPFLKYQTIAVAAAGSPLVTGVPTPARLR